MIVVVGASISKKKKKKLNLDLFLLLFSTQNHLNKQGKVPERSLLRGRDPPPGPPGLATLPGRLPAARRQQGQARGAADAEGDEDARDLPLR